MFGQQQQQGGGGFGRGNTAWGSNKGQQQQGGFGQQAAAGAQGGGMVFGKRVQGGPADSRGPSPGGRGAAGAAGGRAGARQGRGSGAGAGGGGWQDTGGGRGRGRFSGGRGQQQYNQQQYNQQQQQYNQAPQQQQQPRQPRPAVGQQQQQQAPKQQQQPPARSSPSIMSRLGSVFGFSSGAGKQQPQQQPQQQQQQQMQQGYDSAAQVGRGRGRGRGARGRGGYSDQQWQQGGGRQQQGDWDAQQPQQGRGQARGQAGRGRGGRSGWQQQPQWGQGAAVQQQQQLGDGSSGGRGRGRGRDRGRGAGRGGNQVWSRLGSQQQQQQQQQQSRYLGGEEAEMDDAAAAAAAAGAEEGWEDAAGAGDAGGEGGWGQQAGDDGYYEGDDMDMQDYDMDEAYEGGGWGQEEEEQQQAEQEEDDGGAAAAAQGGFFGQQQLKQEAQAVFGAPAAAAAAPAPQPQRAPIPSPSAAGTAVGRPPRAAVPPPPRAAVRAANAAAAAAAAEASPARDVCYAVPAAHAPGSTTASYDAMTPACVALTAAAPRAALKTRARGAKQPACTDMCPAEERAQRTAERQLHPYEREGDEYATTPQLAVKKYQRSHAGEETDNSALRTWPALAKTLAHLRSILGRLGAPDWGTDRQAVFDLLEAHRFLWDRYRALRKDITQTELPLLGPSQLYWVMCANEEMARFMILADALLADKDKVNKDAREAAAAASGKEKAAASPAPRITFDLEGFREAQLAADAEADAAGGNFEPDPYDGHLNHQELTKTLLDLSALYREAARIGLPAPHAGEFMSYYLILSRGTYGRYKASPGNVVRLLTAMSREVLVSPHVRYALAVSSALMASNWVRLLELMEGAPLLLAATVQVYVPGMRSKALVHLLRNEAVTAVGGGGRVKRLSLDYYTRLLRFDDTAQATAFIQLHQATCPGLTITTTSSGEEVIQLPAAERGQLQVLRTIPRHTLHWLADKAGGSSLDQLVITPCPPPDVGALLGMQPAAGNESAAAAVGRGAAAGFGLLVAPGVPSGGGGLFEAGGSVGGAASGFGAAQQAAAAQQLTKKQQQQQDVQQQQQQQQLFQFGAAAAPAAPPDAVIAAAPGFGAAWGQQQQQGQFGFGSTPGGRGSSDVLLSVMPPAAAVAGATAVFGGLTPPAGQFGLQHPPQQQPVAAVGFGAAAAVVVPAAEQQQQQQGTLWQQQQQQQQAAWGQQRPPAQQQPQQAPPAPWQQPQQQQQFISQPQPQQQQQPAAASAAAAVAAAAQAAAAAAAALRAENAALKQKLAKMEAEERDTQQAESLSQELASMRRRRVMRRWRACASAAKAARERVAAQLAGSNATLGRRGEGLLLLGVRRRHKAAAGGPAQRDMQALLTGQDDLDLLAPQGKRQRPLAQADAATVFEAALEDTSPVHVADVMAAALTAAAASSSDTSSSVIYLPSMVSSGLSSSSSSNAAADGGFGFSSSSSSDGGGAGQRGVPCRAAPLVLCLVCVSGWGEADPRFAPPLVQRRVSQWLRHKLADLRSVAAVPGGGPAAAPATNGHGWGQAPQQPQLVPLDGPAATATAAHGQQQQHRTWAGIVKGTSASIQQQQQMVVRVCEGVELLSSRAARAPVGPRQCEVVVEVMDVAPSGLDRACGAGSSNGSSVLAGACGVLLLVSGPDGRELQGAVKRLGLLLEHWPAAVAAPLTVLACSGPSTHSDIQVQLGLQLSRLPPELQARISSAQVVCLGPGGQPPAAALEQALAQAAEAAAPLLPQLHQVQACALLQALTVLELRAKLAAVQALAAAAAAASRSNGNSTVPDLLSAFVEAHNTGLLSLGNCMQAQLDSTAAAWGYPPPNSSSSSSVWAAASRVMQGAPALALPPPQPLHHFLQQQQQQGTAAAALAQLTAYLDALSSSSEGAGGVSDAVRSVATGLRAVLTATLLQQKQLLLPSSNGSSRSSGRQLALVRSHCELLLERLQQQQPLQAWLVVDAADLGLIVAADQEQQQPGWWQQQTGGVGGQLGYEGGAGLLDEEEGPQPWDSPRQQVPLVWHVQGQDRAGGDEEEEEVFDQSPEVAHTVAKQQAAFAAELLAKCRLKPWLA